MAQCSLNLFPSTLMDQSSQRFLETMTQASALNDLGSDSAMTCAQLTCLCDGGDGVLDKRCNTNFFFFILFVSWFLQTCLVAQMVKRLPTMWETQAQSLGQEDLLEKEMATHSNILAWRIPWMEEPGRLQSMDRR